MSPREIDTTLHLAAQQHQAGRLAEAERGYRQVLAQTPEHPEALHLLGILAGQVGRGDVAMEFFTRAIKANPSSAVYHNSMGKALAGAGKLQEAFGYFTRAVELAPSDPEGHNNLGIALREQRRWAEAVASFGRAIALKEDYAEAHYNLGNTLRDQRSLDQAIESYRRAIELRPGLIEAHNNLAIALSDLRRFDEAIGIYRNVIALRPAAAAKAHNNLSGALRELGRFGEALAELDRAVALEPNYALAHMNRGIVLHQLQRLDEALASFAAAIRLSPSSAQAFHRSGDAIKDCGRIDEALAAYRRAIEIDPNSAEAHCSLGNVYQEMGEVDRAAESSARAIELDAKLAEAHNIMGNVLRDRGELDAAMACYRTAVELKPDAPSIQSNLAYCVYFHPDYDPARILEENRSWAQRHEGPVLAAGHEAHPNDRSPDRRLRIGYVSPDFRRHPAASFMLPLLAHHDPQKVEIFCYSGVKQADAVTAQCRSLAHVWRDVAGLSDADLAGQVRRDGIDILVDLTLHMSCNRLLMFARKPAPVQVTWLGYPGTTGMTSIDYRLSDPHMDPPGEGDEYYSEKTIRLRHTFWCYQPPVQTIEVNSLPALQAGHVTFACFNHFAKVTPPALELWASTLAAVPGSRMLILCSPGNHRQRVRDVFERAAGAGDRIEFVARLAPEAYFRLFHRVDLCLDPIPYPGHTSTLDSLWMGVPAVTLRGNTAASRGGASLLTNVDLRQFIATTAEDYVTIARDAATDVAGLARRRAELRPRMVASPLMDAKAFAADMEAAFGEMWRAWCGVARGEQAVRKS